MLDLYLAYTFIMASVDKGGFHMLLSEIAEKVGN